VRAIQDLAGAREEMGGERERMRGPRATPAMGERGDERIRERERGLKGCD